MFSRLRAAVIGVVVLGGLEAPPAALGQSDPTVTAETKADRPPAPRRRRRPIAEAIEKAVDEVMRRHSDPCALATQRGVPCFPTNVEVEGLRFSVADAMRKYRPDGRRAEGAPITASDMREQMSGAPLSDSGGAAFDPVCTVKSLIRRISGTGKYYLYRLSDGSEDRPVLTDRKIDLAVHASNPKARYEYLGEYSGECEAIAAWRKELREAVAPPPLDGTGSPATAPPPPPPVQDEITIEERKPPGSRLPSP